MLLRLTHKIHPDAMLTVVHAIQIYSLETEYLQAEYTQCGTVLKVEFVHGSLLVSCINLQGKAWQS